MKTITLRIRVDSGTVNLLKSRAGSEGKSLSETVRTLILQSLESGRASVPVLDPESVKKAVEAAIQASDLGPLKAEIRALERTLFDARKTDPGSGETSGFAWTKSQAGFLIYTVACISKFFEEYNAAWNANDQQKLMRRTDLVDESGLREVQKYLPGWKKRRGENE